MKYISPEPPVACWCFIACAQDFSNSSSTPSAERRCVQKTARRSLGGAATPACRRKTDLTSAVQLEDEWLRSQSLAIEKR